jgi:hypothetical protein
MVIKSTRGDIQNELRIVTRTKLQSEIVKKNSHMGNVRTYRCINLISTQGVKQIYGMREFFSSWLPERPGISTLPDYGYYERHRVCPELRPGQKQEKNTRI